VTGERHGLESPAGRRARPHEREGGDVRVDLSRSDSREAREKKTRDRKDGVSNSTKAERLSTGGRPKGRQVGLVDRHDGSRFRVA